MLALALQDMENMEAVEEEKHEQDSGRETETIREQSNAAGSEAAADSSSPGLRASACLSPDLDGSKSEKIADPAESD